MAGKGDGQRPRQVSQAEWDRRYQATFPDWRVVQDGERRDDPALEYREFHEILFARPKPS